VSNREDGAFPWIQEKEEEEEGAKITIFQQFCSFELNYKTIAAMFEGNIAQKRKFMVNWF